MRRLVWLLGRVVLGHRVSWSRGGLLIRSDQAVSPIAPGRALAFITIPSLANPEIQDIERMSRKLPGAGEEKTMSARLDAWPDPPETDHLQALRHRLLQSTQGTVAHVPRRDAEDVVQDAMVRFLGETPKPSSPPDEVRAHVALKRERANYYRRRDRRPEQLTAEPVALHATGSGPDARLVQAAVAIEQIAGRDTRLLAELRGKGYTFDDIARELQWTPQRVDAARKQLDRNRERIAVALAIQLREVPGGE